MKSILYIIVCLIVTNGISAQGITKYGESTTTSTNFINLNGKIGISPWLNKNGQWILNIGDSYQGGIIAYILQPGDPGYISGETHGLIAAPSNQSIFAGWGCIGTVISGSDGTAIGTGNQNTIDIMAGCSTAGIAARICGDLELGGYSDWYLPSKDELNKLYLNRTAIGGFINSSYWRSSEVDGNVAWYNDFHYSGQSGNNKDFGHYVRAVRSF